MEKRIDSKNIIKIILVVSALSLIAIGIIREEHLIVFNKAIKVCLQCIGIG